LSHLKGKKRTVKTKGRKGKRKKRLYFGPDTDLAILNYQQSDCITTKKQLYTESIQPSFSKLAENLIFIHGFAKNHHSYEALKGDCVSFLFETLQKFDATKGSKAFSYFNVVAKNWLIIQSKKRVKNVTRNLSLSNFKDFKAKDKELIESHNHVPAQDNIIISEENKDILDEIIGKIKRRVNNPNDVSCINAVEHLFSHIDDLDFLNKRAIFVYMRDISGLTPKQLSVSMSNIRKIYRDIKKTDVEYFSLFFN
jgi:hypothetical protein